MRAVRIVEGSKDFVVQDVAAPLCRADGLVVRMEAAMVASYMRELPLGNWLTPARPFIPGQCAVGIVEQSNDRIAAGQRVYFDAFIGSRCAADPAGNHGFLGCFALSEAAMPMMNAWPDGSFAERIHAPADCFTPLPGLAVPADLLCRLGWLGTAVHGLRRGGFAAGMRIAINGSTGIVGAGAAVLALALGVAEVHVFGRNSLRLEELVRLAPSRVCLGQIDDGSTYDMVLDCAAGNDSGPSARLVAKLRRFATAVFVGGLSEAMPLDCGRLMRNSNSVVGSYWFTKQDLEHLILMISSGVLDLGIFRARAFRLDDIEAAIRYASCEAGGLEHTVLCP